MLFILNLILFAAASSIVLHFCMRKYYGKSMLIWFWVEYIWCLLSFVALFLANIQIKDKIQNAQIEIYKIEIGNLWDQVNETGDNIQTRVVPEMTESFFKEHPAVNRMTLSYLSRLKLYEKKLPPYRVLKDVYWNIPLLFCEGMFGEEAHHENWRKIISTFRFDMTRSEHFWVESAQVCLDWFEISDKAKQVSDYEDLRSGLDIIYNLSFYWSFILAFGLALKLTKTNSDFVALRQKTAAQ